MSDTPRTDAQLRKPIHDTGISSNLFEFCRDLEREIRQLEVAIYDLKTENNALRNDKKRLDWLMSMVGWASTREDIDRMLGDEEDDGDLDRLNQDI